MRKQTRIRLAGLAAGGWLAGTKLASAAPNNEMPDIGANRLDGGMTGYLIWVIVALLLVIGLIVLLIKWLSVRSRGWGLSRSLRSLGGMPLGQNKSLQVVELAGRIYIVGVGDSITLLDKIEDPEKAQEIVRSLEQQHGRSWNPQPLTDFINRFRNRKSPDQPTNEPWRQAASFQEMLQNRLKSQADRKQKMEELLREQNHNDRLLDE
jgi:flagellar protein FliO/FliZ